jgi:hypothetical protein
LLINDNFRILFRLNDSDASKISAVDMLSISLFVLPVGVIKSFFDGI